jgi:hypothetical protein
MNRLTVVVSCLVLVSGCAVGRKHVYDSGVPRLQQGGVTSVAVAVHDRRQRVLTQKDDPNVSGVMRGGFGNPWDVTTESGQPLAEDFALTIRRALAKRGYRVAAVGTVHSQSPEDVLRALARTGAARSLAIQITVWKSDTYIDTDLTYNLSATVLDPAGLVVGQATVNGQDALGGDFIDPPSFAESAVPKAYIAKLEALLNHPTIVHGLKAPTEAPVRPAPSSPPAPAAPPEQATAPP